MKRIIPADDIDKSKIETGYFLIGRVIKEYFGIIFKCPKCNKLYCFQKFTLADFFSDQMIPTFICKICKTKTIYDQTNFKSCLHQVWNDDKYFEKWLVYIFKEV